MLRTLAEVTTRGRAALVVALVGVVSVLSTATLAASLAPTMTTQAVIVLAALSTARALSGVHCLLTVPGAGLHSLLPRRRAADVPLVLAGASTDVVHRPARPRAPGLV